MKFSNAIGLAALPIALALPSGPLKGVRIRDPARLEKLKLEHEHALEVMRNHALSQRSPSGEDIHDKRQAQVLAIGGLAVIEAVGLGGKVVEKALQNIKKVFGGDTDNIWENPSHCRVDFSTHGGGNCKVDTYKRDVDDPSGTHDEDGACSWIDPEKNDPPVVWYDGDDGIGKFSFQWTATDEHAWDGIDGTEKCVVQGVCNPQIIFYHDEYKIVLNTWQSEGDSSSCYYSAGEDCKGLCSYGVKDQFKKGGALWGGSCAIPCSEDGGLPDV